MGSAPPENEEITLANPVVKEALIFLANWLKDASNMDAPAYEGTAADVFWELRDGRERFGDEPIEAWLLNWGLGVEKARRIALIAADIAAKSHFVATREAR